MRLFGTADFGTADVTISAENPIKIVAQKATWNGSEFTVSEETVIDATSVNVSGAGNGHSIGTDEFTLDGKDDVIGSYTIDPTSGRIIFTPKKKFENVEHQESVNIGILAIIDIFQFQILVFLMMLLLKK